MSYSSDGGWTDQPYACRPGENQVAIVVGCNAYYFDEVEDPPGTFTYTQSPAGKQSLAFDSEQCIFIFTDECDGSTRRFENHSGNPLDGEDAGGQSWDYEYGEGGMEGFSLLETTSTVLNAVQRSVDQDGRTIVDRIEYEYFDSGDNVGRLKSSTWTRQVNPVALLKRILYAYYGADDPNGSVGDLKTATTQLMHGTTWVDQETQYFRYYKDGDPKGFAHAMKFNVKAPAFVRLCQDPQGTDPLLATDAIVSKYADYYYEYDVDHRVAKSVTRCGLLSYRYFYTVSAHADEYENWKLRTELRKPDGSIEILYSNYITQPLLREVRAGGKQWITAYAYDAQARLIQEASPSAVVSYSDSAADLDIVLRTNEGLIRTTQYAATTTATSSTAGDVAGYVRTTKVQRGTSPTTGGGPYLQSLTKYFKREVDSGTIYPVAESSTFRNDTNSESDSGKLTTSYAFLWFDDSLQYRERTTTYPAVPTDQNGPGSGVPTSIVEVFDVYGNRTWLKNQRGFITYQKFDIVTGAVIQTIDDVDVLKMTGVPSGWTTPEGGGLHLITDFESDPFGRTTQSLGPWFDSDGQSVRKADWTVYRDLEHETYRGRGFAFGPVQNLQYQLMNPVMVTRSAADGLTVDRISAVRSHEAGRLNAADCFPQSSWVRWSRSIKNLHGQEIASRSYFLIPNCGDGLEGKNYAESTFGYDVSGKQNRRRSPGGTITRSVFDGLGHTISTWVGTNDHGATDAAPNAGGRFDPTLLRGLEFWGSGEFGLFQDSSGTPATQAGDPIARWYDRRPGSSRYFYQSTSGSRPTISAEVINGRQAVRFNQSGGTRYLKLDDSLFSANATSPATIFAVFRAKSDSGGQRAIMKQSNDGEYSLCLIRSFNNDNTLSTMSNKTGTALQLASDAHTTTAGEICVVACVWDAGTMYFYRDGSFRNKVEITNSQILSASTNTRGWSIGCELHGGSPGDPTNADFAEFMIFSQALTADELIGLFDWAASTATSNNMVCTSTSEYDDGNGAGDGNLTRTTEIVDDLTVRVTEYGYDWRNRQVYVDGELDYYQENVFDNLGNITQVDIRNGNSTAGLLARSQTFFDNLGRVYRSKRFAVNPTNGAIGNALIDDTWFDATGNIAKQVAAGSKDQKAFSKFAYDGLNRRFGEYVGYYTESGTESYSDAITITSDNKLFAQTIQEFDGAGNTLTTMAYQRLHDATGNGILQAPFADLQPAARVSYGAQWYDGIGRATASASFGTNDNAPFERPDMAPARSDTVLVTTFGYDAAGNANRTVGPDGREGRRAFDQLGRTVMTVSNFVANTSASPTDPDLNPDCCAPTLPDWTCGLTAGNETNVIVLQTFDVDGHLIRLTACNPSTGDQVTRYDYGVTLSDGPIASNDLLGSVVYPDAVDSNDRVRYAYNRQRQLIRFEDQNGTVHEYLYDLLGRRTSDVVATLGTGVDGSIRRISQSYDDRGLTETVTSYSDVSGATVVNQVRYEYNHFAQLTFEYQNHSGEAVP